MKLYGTTTSPFVRRVRVVAAELGEPIELVLTSTDEGQRALAAVTPIRKVPVADLDGRGAPAFGRGAEGRRGFGDGGLLFDSRAIIEWLTTTRGWGNLAPPRNRWFDANLINAIDAALDSVIQLFYLKRDGVAAEGSPFHERQLARADSIFAWLGQQLAPHGRGFGDGLGLAEISLVCTLEWMDFRSAYPTSLAGAVAGVRAAWGEHPSLVATRPAP